MSPQPLTDFTAYGSPFEVGRQIGAEFAEPIRTFLDDELARINPLRRSPLSRSEALRLATRYGNAIEGVLPDIAEEIGGLAVGAQISYPEAVLLQIRRELIRHDSDEHGSDECTSIAFNSKGSVILAQTVDLAGGMSEHAQIVRIVPDDASPTVCMFTFTGLCGFAGLNSAGLAVGLNMVLSPGWRVGVPVYLLVRHLLTLRSIEEALAAIARIPRASSRYLILAERTRATGVEMTVDEHRVLNGLPIIHANHFVSADFAHLDEVPASFRTASVKRVMRAQALASFGAKPEEILRDHEHSPLSICCHRSGEGASPETVGALISDPGAKILRAVRGHPCCALLQSFATAQ